MATWVNACVAGALGAQLGLVDLPDAAAGNWHLLKLLKQLLHARAQGLPDHRPRELQGVRGRLQSHARPLILLPSAAADCMLKTHAHETPCTHRHMGGALQAPGLAHASTRDDKSRQRPAKGTLILCCMSVVSVVSGVLGLIHAIVTTTFTIWCPQVPHVQGTNLGREGAPGWRRRRAGTDR